MAPAHACQDFLASTKPLSSDHIEVTLFNSLALTGDGHLTISIIKKLFSPLPTEIKTKIDNAFHPNYFLIKLFDKDDNLKQEQNYTSIGGGDLLINGLSSKLEDCYPHNTFEAIKQYCLENNITLYDYVYRFDGADIKDYLTKIYEQMMQTIDNGLTATTILPGKLKLARKAKLLYEKNIKNEPPEIKESRLVSAYAYATAEQNASGGVIVTAPTCGACGVIPAIIRYMQEKHPFINQTRIINGLAVAGLIGNIIKTNASISGAVAGCQAEIGSATAMASALHATLFNLKISQIEYASEIAIEHQLGLTCDPVMGYVQIPCIERNAVAAIRAINACGLAFFLSDTRTISLDTVIETMYQTGLDLNTQYKETALGGLAKMYNRNLNSK